MMGDEILLMQRILHYQLEGDRVQASSQHRWLEVPVIALFECLCKLIFKSMHVD